MNIKFTDSPSYKNLIKTQFIEAISLLFSENQEFQIVCEVKDIRFSPSLPQEIQENFNEMVMFAIGGYTFETAILEDDALLFEAGFGTNNFASKLLIPVLALKQIIVDENPIMLNHSSYIKEEVKTAKSSANTSMEALLNNPKNKKFIKKKALDKK